jgi:hypothetical protein
MSNNILLYFCEKYKYLTEYKNNIINGRLNSLISKTYNKTLRKKLCIKLENKKMNELLKLNFYIEYKYPEITIYSYNGKIIWQWYKYNTHIKIIDNIKQIIKYILIKTGKITDMITIKKELQINKYKKIRFKENLDQYTTNYVKFIYSNIKNYLTKSIITYYKGRYFMQFNRKYYSLYIYIIRYKYITYNKYFTTLIFIPNKYELLYCSKLFLVLN